MWVIMHATLRRRRRSVLLLDCGLRRPFREPPHEHEAARDVRGALGVAGLEVARGLAHHRAEPAAERAEAAEAHGVTDLGHGEVRRAQEVLGALDASP